MSTGRTPGSPPQRDALTQLLIQCTLYVQGEHPGTGVFVAPSVVATCTHVVGKALSQPENVMLVVWAGQAFSVTAADVLCSLPVNDEDLTLLRVPVEGHPCVPLDPAIETGEPLFAHGYPVVEAGTGASPDDLIGETVGMTYMDRRHWMLKFQAPDVPEGFSGAPLLNRSRQAVSGLITESRGIGRGGRGIPASIILDSMPSTVKAEYERFHAHDRRWKAACRSGTPSHQRTAVSQLPPFWPHLCDRWEQGGALSLALREHGEQRSRRPFVFVAHGDQRELHDGFRERLRHEDLIQYVTPRPREVPVELFTLALSLSRGGPTLRAQIMAGLAGRLQCSVERVPAMLMQRINVALLYASITTSEWSRDGERLLKEFLSVWSEWPDVGTRQILLVLLSVQYECADPDDEESEWAFPQRVRQMKNLLDALGKPEMRAAFPGIGYVVLPPLSAPQSMHAKAVVEIPSVSRFLRPEVRTRWDERVDQVFGRRARMPMQYLMPALNEALKTLLNEENGA